MAYLFLKGPKFPLMEGVRQLHALTELDLSNNKLSDDLQEQMQVNQAV